MLKKTLKLVVIYMHTHKYLANTIILFIYLFVFRAHLYHSLTHYILEELVPSGGGAWRGAFSGSFLSRRTTLFPILQLDFVAGVGGPHLTSMRSFAAAVTVVVVSRRRWVSMSWWWIFSLALAPFTYFNRIREFAVEIAAVPVK